MQCGSSRLPLIIYRWFAALLTLITFIGEFIVSKDFTNLRFFTVWSIAVIAFYFALAAVIRYLVNVNIFMNAFALKLRKKKKFARDF